MKKFNIIYLITFTLAFCSMSYELILAQTLAAFLENTILRYSITIGLYMCSMGFGALAVEGFQAKNPQSILLKVEILLTLLGGFCVVILHLTQMAFPSRFGFNLIAHGLIILIGFLTGFEVPLLIALQKNNQENKILGLNYAGAFMGTMIFAFVFFPFMGLMSAAFLTSLLNAAAGLLLFTQRATVSNQSRNLFNVFLGVQLFLFCCIILCLLNSNRINDLFMKYYLM